MLVRKFLREYLKEAWKEVPAEKEMVEEGTGREGETGEKEKIIGYDKQGITIVNQTRDPSRLNHNNFFKCIKIIWDYSKSTKFKING